MGWLVQSCDAMGIDEQIGHGDPFHNDRHLDPKATYVRANTLFNDSDWRGEPLKDDKHWAYGVQVGRQGRCVTVAGAVR